MQYMGRTPGYGSAVALGAVLPEWEQTIFEILDLCVSVTDQNLRPTIAPLSFIEKCQAITRLAEVMGHGWMPVGGEDFAEMARTGRHPNQFFRPLTEVPHKKYTFTTLGVHIVGDSTLNFTIKGHGGTSA